MNSTGEVVTHPPPAGAGGSAENDPSEKINVQAKYPKVVRELKQALARIIQQGRSTTGKPQQNSPAKKGWPQVDWMKE